MPHEQYLDEPGDSIQWTVRIDALVKRIRDEKEEQAKAES